MRRLAFAYGLLAAVAAVLTMLYFVGFTGGFGVPKDVDGGEPGPIGIALLVDLVLLGIFGLQHSLMARPAFKRWTRPLNASTVERSTYVLLASLALALLFWQWRPMPAVVWHLGEPAHTIVLAVSGAGWLLLLVAATAIGPLELLGLARVHDHLRGRAETAPVFRTPGPYALVRHPLMTGFLLVFWAAPTMTAGRLLLAAAMTVYILVAIRLEERDLIEVFGRRYRQYRDEIPALIPDPRRRLRHTRSGPRGQPAKDDTLGG